MTSTKSLENFKHNVEDKYTIYNSLFAALPFSGVANSGALLPILLQACNEGYKEQKTPKEIIDTFFASHTKISDEKEKADWMFKFIQYIERQVVLFDSIEDAAFADVHDMEGSGSLKRLISDAIFAGKTKELQEKFLSFKVRMVLTAHPTQFYPASVLGIIHDMAGAIKKNDFQTINDYIRQLGITPFFNKKKPTPYDEALNLMWYLENILYHSVGKIYDFINKEVYNGLYEGENPFVEVGFWPGGDRDGNPYVDASTTLKVSRALHTTILLCYYRDVRKLRRRLTFTVVDRMLNNLEQLLYENVFHPEVATYITKPLLLEVLYEIRQVLIDKHFSLFIDLFDSLLHKVKIFGTHFAPLDIRQNSKVHSDVIKSIIEILQSQGKAPVLPEIYSSLPDDEKIAALKKCSASLNPLDFPEGIVRDTLQSIYIIKEIQEVNGEAGCNRYIISNCTSAVNVMEVYALFKLCGWNENELKVDIVPLFETVEDLAAAEKVMEILYSDEVYSKHLQNRFSHQTIMVGFSDGTKDGGYLQANWSIFKAKEAITAISRRNQIKVKFFDGRGGPPSRGGGKSNRFYASLGSGIENEEIQVTVQGQTITSNFGTVQSSQYKLEQLLNAGISNDIFPDRSGKLTAESRKILDEISLVGYEYYQELKKHPLFLAYLQELSPLNYYGKTNIASRPTKRGSGELRFEDLRAIPFVGSWSQIKQNVPGFYGVGTALQHAKQNGHWEHLKEMYSNVLFFKTLIDNSVMSMLKSFFPLTQHYASHEKFGTLWQLIYTEFKLTTELVLDLTDSKVLMEGEKSGRASILMRDNIVLPLLTIQQYALQKINMEEFEEGMKDVYGNLITRSMFGIINAGRNSA